jgi:hypothetical protein
MFFADAQIRVHLYGQPTDMRKSYDGLQALARHAMGQAVFVLKPAADAFFAPIRGKRGPIAVDLVLCFAMDHEGDRLSEFLLRSTIECQIALAVEFELNGQSVFTISTSSSWR